MFGHYVTRVIIFPVSLKSFFSLRFQSFIAITFPTSGPTDNATYLNILM